MSDEATSSGSWRSIGSILRRQPRSLSVSQKWLLGLVNLSLVVVLWVVSSFLVNSLVQDGTYRKPFFITYVNTGCFSLYLVLYLYNHGLSPRQFYHQWKQDCHMNRLVKSGLSPVHLNASLLREVMQYGSNSDDGSASDLETLNVKQNIGIAETINLSLQFVVLWFTANYVMNASLSYTSVASQTILSSTSSFFTLLIGYLNAVERVNRIKIAGLVLSFAGVVIVTRIDASTSHPSISATWVVWGNVLALLGAIIYGVYTTLLKLKTTIPNSLLERNLDTHLFFGFVGIFCIIFLWPVLVVLHMTNLEPFALPRTQSVISVLLVNTVVTFISDLCWCKAVLFTSPLTVTVGLSMTIPLAMVGDWILKGFHFNGWYLFGAFIVMIGFFIVNRDEKRDTLQAQIVE